MPAEAYLEFAFHNAHASHMHRHFMPKVFELSGQIGAGTRVLDVGCGNGFTCGEFAKLGCRVVGVDMSHSGIALARKTFPNCRFETISASVDFLATLGEAPFDLIISTEVVEHLYDPRAYVRSCFKALRPGGRFVCTTPYHGYFKNVALTVAGKWDFHMNPLWDCGHIKFWSRATLTRLLTEAGFTGCQFRGAGRLPYLWMTMVMAADKPQ